MRAVEKHLCSLRSRAMNWIYENLIARKKVHLACCACYHPHWTTVLCIERKPKQRKKSLCLFSSLFRSFSGNLWLPFEDVRSLIGIVQYSIDVPATNLFILLHCDLVGSAHQLSETKQREFSQRERAKLKRYPKSCQKGIEECFSHKTKVSLIIVSCCDQRDHMSVAVPYTAVYIQTPFASEYHLSIQSATIIYLLLFIRFTLFSPILLIRWVVLFSSGSGYLQSIRNDRFGFFAFFNCLPSSLCQFEFVRSFTFIEKRLEVL